MLVTDILSALSYTVLAKLLMNSSRHISYKSAQFGPASWAIH